LFIVLLLYKLEQVVGLLFLPTVDIQPQFERMALSLCGVVIILVSLAKTTVIIVHRQFKLEQVVGLLSLLHTAQQADLGLHLQYDLMELYGGGGPMAMASSA
jgi:hypothetical protein